MAENEYDDDYERESQRFDVQLFIKHPSLHPTDITTALGLEPTIAMTVGELRATPKGTLTGGRYDRTAWRYKNRYEITDQWFAGRVAELVDRLMPHKAFLCELTETGGYSCLIISFLGDDGHFGDELSIETLRKMTEMKMKFAIELYTVCQS
jgi:hypothetical protein